MLTNEQGKAIGWTPQEAFKEYTPTEEEALAMDSILPPSVNSNKKRNWEAHTFRCLFQKCSRKSYFGFADEPIPRFCDHHKLEGMVELGSWKPSFRKGDVGVPRHVPTKRGVPQALVCTQEQNVQSNLPTPPPPRKKVCKTEQPQAKPCTENAQEKPQGKGRKKSAKTSAPGGYALPVPVPVVAAKERATNGATRRKVPFSLTKSRVPAITAP